MKKYTVKPNEDLGSIAKKFWLPSWKYLYELNKDVIGDNPDLLKEGTKLQIPQWDSTSGDEKIKEKDAEPFEYCNGLRYAYPWVPFSLSLTNAQKNLLENFEDKRDYEIFDKKKKTVLAAGMIKNADELELLIPDTTDYRVGIKGFPVYINGELHKHPDDESTGSPDSAASIDDDDEFKKDNL